jgi:hypothetical protein
VLEGDDVVVVGDLLDGAVGGVLARAGFEALVTGGEGKEDEEREDGAQDW